MTYEQLRQYAKPHIRQGAELPSNAFILLMQLHIPFKDQEQCEKDFRGKMTPLYNHPAFLAVTDSEKTIYFNTKAKYWNFYLFHEIAHYLLGHEDDSPQNELDADILACILAAPIENLPSYLKSARDLSSLCQIPIDKAEAYWQEISGNFSATNKKILTTGIALMIALIVIGAIATFNNFSTTTENKISTHEQVENADNEDNSINTYYKTSSGTHFHKPDCRYVKYNTNIISISTEEAEILKLAPCSECID